MVTKYNCSELTCENGEILSWEAAGATADEGQHSNMIIFSTFF